MHPSYSWNDIRGAANVSYSHFTFVDVQKDIKLQAYYRGLNADVAGNTQFLSLLSGLFVRVLVCALVFNSYISGSV